MIVIGVGHASVERFVLEKTAQNVYSEDIVIIQNWDQVVHNLAAARKIFVGERLLRGVSREQVLAAARSTVHIQWAIWTAENSLWTGVASENLQIWAGELTPEKLEEWIQEPSYLSGAALASQWMLWSPSGCEDRTQSIAQLTGKMRGLYGAGTWVDLDWVQSLVTRLWKGQGAGDESYPYARLHRQTAEWGWIVPAPMPWIPVLFQPEMRDIEKSLRSVQGWQGWDIGVDLRGLSVGTVAAFVELVVIHLSANTPPEVLEHGLALLRAVNPRLRFVAVGPDPSYLGRRCGIVSLSQDVLPAKGLKRFFARRGQAADR